MIKKTVKIMETVLAVFVLVGVIMYLIGTIGSFATADWGDNKVFYDLIYEALLITIGLELARMLVTHDYRSILELLAFVVARKMLKPEITTIDIVLGIVSFVGILLAKKFLFTPKVQNQLSG